MASFLLKSLLICLCAGMSIAQQHQGTGLQSYSGYAAPYQYGGQNAQYPINNHAGLQSQNPNNRIFGLLGGGSGGGLFGNLLSGLTGGNRYPTSYPYPVPVPSYGGFGGYPGIGGGYPGIGGGYPGFGGGFPGYGYGGGFYG
ncbi:shematrin-like protein 2 [Teleopsis dalmanni]|uniref:shematrin-like protein 2 n=1 Tax=Teleopsis dalmanni TaxID=139649 RepID=UPI0018CE19C0|nr:shematrin-like protein 2 [Teleopsis dalmanni]